MPEEVLDAIARSITFGRSDTLRGLTGTVLVAVAVLLSALPRVYGASYVQIARCSVQYAHGFSPSQRRLRDLQLSQARVTRRRLERGRRSICWSFPFGMMALWTRRCLADEKGFPHQRVEKVNRRCGEVCCFKPREVHISTCSC